MDTSTARPGDGGGETKKQQIDRELIELLNEIRVALPGVQFLFAFLLVVPFQQRAGRITDFQREVYVVTLISAALASILLIAPAAQHRVLFRQHDKEALLRRSSRSAFAGLMVLIVAISAALLLVLDVFIGYWQAWVTSSVIALLLVWWWAVVPLWHRAHDEQDEPGA
ncbi:MAG TPA: DUF6328 family protein [Blastococcus sp.]|nr:DUF6328 family protein [Blastococcus sp.]